MGLLDNQGQNETGNWNQFQLLVMHQLKTNADETEKVKGELKKLAIEVAVLQYKAGVWGLLAGIIPAVGILLWELIRPR